MNQLFEIIKINHSTIIVIGKTYYGVSYYIQELEIELAKRHFKGEIIFDLLLSNGLRAKNRFIHSCYYGIKLEKFNTININMIKVEYKRYMVDFYRKNINILDNGILLRKDLELLKQQLMSTDFTF